MKVEVFDVTGRVTKTLIDGVTPAGQYQQTFDGSELPSGIYFAKSTGRRIIQHAENDSVEVVSKKFRQIQNGRGILHARFFVCISPLRWTL